MCSFSNRILFSLSISVKRSTVNLETLTFKNLLFFKVNTEMRISLRLLYSCTRLSILDPFNNLFVFNINSISFNFTAMDIDFPHFIILLIMHSLEYFRCIHGVCLAHFQFYRYLVQIQVNTSVFPPNLLV